MHVSITLKPDANTETAQRLGLSHFDSSETIQIPATQIPATSPIAVLFFPFQKFFFKKKTVTRLADTNDYGGGEPPDFRTKIPSATNAADCNSLYNKMIATMIRAGDDHRLNMEPQNAWIASVSVDIKLEIFPTLLPDRPSGLSLVALCYCKSSELRTSAQIP